MAAYPFLVRPIHGLPFAHAVRYFAASLYDASPWATVARELAWLLGLGLLFGALARVATRRLSS